MNSINEDSHTHIDAEIINVKNSNLNDGSFLKKGHVGADSQKKRKMEKVNKKGC